MLYLMYLNVRDRVLYFCSWLQINIMWSPENHRFSRLFFEFTICKHLFFGRSIWPPHKAYVMEDLNTGQAILKSLNAPGFRGVAQACWSIETFNRSTHYIDFRNRRSVFLCYYQTTTNFFHSVQNARNFMWPYCWVLKSRWCQCLRGYE